MRLKTMEYLATSTITLTSLAQLLGKISNMVINDHIQEQVEQALEAIHQVREQLFVTAFQVLQGVILGCGAKLERRTLERVLRGGPPVVAPVPFRLPDSPQFPTYLVSLVVVI